MGSDGFVACADGNAFLVPALVTGLAGPLTFIHLLDRSKCAMISLRVTIISCPRPRATYRCKVTERSCWQLRGVTGNRYCVQAPVPSALAFILQSLTHSALLSSGFGGIKLSDSLIRCHTSCNCKVQGPHTPLAATHRNADNGPVGAGLDASLDRFWKTRCLASKDEPVPRPV